MQTNAEKIIDVLRYEQGKAHIADVLAGTTIEPKQLVEELDSLRQKGLLEVRPEALADMRTFMKKDDAFTLAASSAADRRLSAFYYLVTPERLESGFRVSLLSKQPTPP